MLFRLFCPTHQRIRENALLTHTLVRLQLCLILSFFPHSNPWFLDPTTINDARFMIPYLYWMLGIPKRTRIESIKVHLPYPCHVQKPPCHLVAVLMEDVVYHFHLNHLRYAILDRMMKRSKLFSMRSIESTEVITD